MTDVPFLPEAETEFLDIVDRYAADGEELASDFVAEVERAARRAASFPDHGSPFLLGTRRIVLARFPFGLIYSIEAGAVVVVALAHHRRRPRYWSDRPLDRSV